MGVEWFNSTSALSLSAFAHAWLAFKCEEAGDKIGLFLMPCRGLICTRSLKSRSLCLGGATQAMILKMKIGHIQKCPHCHLQDIKRLIPTYDLTASWLATRCHSLSKTEVQTQDILVPTTTTLFNQDLGVQSHPGVKVLSLPAWQFGCPYNENHVSRHEHRPCRGQHSPKKNRRHCMVLSISRVCVLVSCKGSAANFLLKAEDPGSESAKLKRKWEHPCLLRVVWPPICSLGRRESG